MDALRSRKHRVERLPDVSAEQEFLESGLDLSDYQQDYVVDRVKVTLFVPDPESLRSHIRAEGGVAGLRRIDVATLESLFLQQSARPDNEGVLPRMGGHAGPGMCLKIGRRFEG